MHDARSIGKFGVVPPILQGMSISTLKERLFA